MGKDKTIFNLDNKDNGPHTWDYYIQQLNEGGEWHPYKNIILSVRSLKETINLFLILVNSGGM